MTITLPIYYTQTFKTKKDKTFLVGLNWERNAHYHIKSEVKRHYHELIAKQVPTPTTSIKQFRTTAKLYWKNSASDGRNIVPMIEKYLLDGLQECGYLTNDTVLFDLGGSWEPITQDKTNPRVEITIQEV